jgi:uncharacterized membrane protein
VPLHNLLYVFLVTLLPWIELRGSIPLGIALGSPWLAVFAVAVATNVALGPLVFFALERLLPLARRARFVDALYKRVVVGVQRRAHRYVEKYGFFGIVFFVAVPLPGSGSWSGALAAFLLGVDWRRFALANAIGVAVAGVIVTAASLGFLLLPLP